MDARDHLVFDALTRELAASKRVQLEDRAPYFLKQGARGPTAREESRLC